MGRIGNFFKKIGRGIGKANRKMIEFTRKIPVIGTITSKVPGFKHIENASYNLYKKMENMK